ncbi:uncharacterized protein LOC117639709 [Thrips palmi]|uniref:Uncharacterized protein LOC117639709 n=1 Tax=Thrips palmi TaxID=161013 RepID=A0A6P8Y666_THRPL|nr:uncharacterized protein LOC117639709 [Thrips palmi]
MAGRLRTTMWTLLVIGVLHFVLGTGTILSAQKYSTVTLWFYGRRARWAAVANLLLCVEEVAVLAVAVVAYYSLLAVVFVVFSACTALFRAIASASLGAGARGQRAADAPRLPDPPAAHGEHGVRLATALPTPPRRDTPLLVQLGAAFLVPLVVTVELIGTLNTATPAKFVNLAVRLVANIFVPLCVVGQMLETAGGLLEVSLYEGPWTEEDAASRLLRLLLMQAAAPDGGITALGLGRLNARSGLGLLRQWFNSINVLSKLTN